MPKWLMVLTLLTAICCPACSKDSAELVKAASAGDKAKAEQLLAAGADPDSAADLETPNTTALHAAAKGGHPDVVAVLLAHGADPTKKDGRGKSAKECAAMRQSPGNLDAFGLIHQTLRKKRGDKTVTIEGKMAVLPEGQDGDPPLTLVLKDGTKQHSLSLSSLVTQTQGFHQPWPGTITVFPGATVRVVGFVDDKGALEVTSLELLAGHSTGRRELPIPRLFPAVADQWSRLAPRQADKAPAPHKRTEQPRSPEVTEQPSNVVVAVDTSMGTIEVELWADRAPITVANFLSYVDKGFFDGTIFHRVIPKFMIQGGGFTPDMNQKPTGRPIKNEAGNGAKNDRGTIAMARTGVVDSATAQFFINLADNGFLNQRDKTSAGFGYAVFGTVVNGMGVVDEIAAVKTGQKGQHENVPVDQVTIRSIRRK